MTRTTASAAPLLSVILPCRNAAEHLAEAIASVEAQTFTNCEVIAADDGSCDDTLALLEAWAARDRRVRVLAQPARGIVAALRSAVAAAEGELLARMDADDVAHPDRFGEQVALLLRDRRVAACGTRVRYFPCEQVRAGARRYEQWLNALVTPDDVERDMFVECPLAHPALMMRRAAYERAGGYEDRGWPEDYDLVLRLWRDGGRLVNVPRVLLSWRERAGRLSRTDGRYSEHRFQQCKAHYLVRTLARDREIVVWGAGPVGKRFARALRAEGALVVAFVDLDPRKIGQVIHNVPVIAPSRIGDYPAAFTVAAVSGSGPRAEIRAALRHAGRSELRDFCAVA